MPTAVKFFNWLGTMWHGSLSFKTPMLWAAGFLVTAGTATRRAASYGGRAAPDAADERQQSSGTQGYGCSTTFV